MNLAPRSSLGNNLTLKRRRGRRNLNRANDTDNLQPSELATKKSLRPFSIGASYAGPSSSSSSIPLSDSDEEPFSLSQNGSRIHAHVEDTNSRNSRELTRSMTADIFGSTRPSIHDWDGKDSDIEAASDTLSETCSLEALDHDLPLAFINQLPNELLTLIFSYGSQLPHFELRYPLTPVPPFKTPSLMETVMCVCSRWRQLAKHTPSLWTSLLVTRSRGDLDRLPVADFQKPINSIDHALTRSQNLPIDIVLDCTHLSTKTVIRDQLAVSSERWKSLSIIVPTAQNLSTVLAHLKDIRAPMLECLVITAHKFHEGDLPNLPPPHAFFQSSPRLTTVRLNRVALRWSASPLRGITTLELCFIIWPTHTDFQNLFSNSPGLQNLKLHFDTHAFARLDRNTGPVNLTMVRPLIKIPCLRTLQLRFIYHDSSSTHNIIPLLQLFSLPALEELTLTDFGTAEWCRSLVYFRFYAKAFPKLTRLILNRVKDIIYVDSSLVRAFPLLTSLRLVGVYSSAFCRLLCGSKTQDIVTDELPSSSYEVGVWPGLEELAIEQDPDGKLELVAEAVRARKQTGRPLHSLQLDREFFDKANREGKGQVIEWLKGVTEVRYIC